MSAREEIISAKKEEGNALALAWCPGCGDRIPTEVVRERGVCSNCYGTSDDPWAAARAETTTATTEDTARAIHRALAPRWMSVAQALGPGQDAYEAMLADIAQALADAGLLATAHTVNVHPTYTVEYQQKIADELGVEREAVLRALGLAAPLLATARTRPTRDDISDAIEHSGIAIGTSDAEQAADAVLALFRGGGK